MGLRGASMLTIALLAGAATAKAPPPPPSDPAAVKAVIACRALTESAQRLDCFDRTTGALDRAIAQRDITVLDRQQVRETRRSLFGFSLPRLALFGIPDQDEHGKPEEIEELDSTITAVRQAGFGHWTITIADGGAVWRNLDPLDEAPPIGAKVHIKKAMLGSYFFKVGSDRAIKAIRVG